MKNTILFIVVWLVAVLIATFLGLWWSPWLAGLIAGLSSSFKGWKGALWSLILGLMFWMIWSGLLIQNGAAIIHEKMADVLNIGNSTLLFFITSLLGGLLSVLGFGCGRSLRGLVG